MKVLITGISLLVAISLFIGCNVEQEQENTTEFKFFSEQFSDLKVIRYQISGFEELSAKEKELCYYLYQAALCGRDMIYDQKYKHNLFVRRSLEAIVNSYNGDKESEDFKSFMVYTKRFWFSNGIHHHYSTDKIAPEFDEAYLMTLVDGSDEAQFPLKQGNTIDSLKASLTKIMFDMSIGAKGVNLNDEVDIVEESANNFYENVDRDEVENYYRNMTDTADPTPVLYGLNSKLMRVNGEIVEQEWKLGGMYGEAIEQIVYWLKKASGVAENDQQQLVIDKLVTYYETGSLRAFDEYNIEWVKDTTSRIDFVNGFIEVYGDPLGMRGSYEAIVSIRDMEATKRIAAISNEAQWFEDHMPIMPEHRKDTVKGISAKVITVVAQSGDAHPYSAIGINLPNSGWIRANHGSKSVTLSNIVDAYDGASNEMPASMLEEFAYSEGEISRSKEHSSVARFLHVDMHEVIGHASGKINEGANPREALSPNYSALEEARADLVAMCFFFDQKLIDIGVMPSFEVGKAAYDSYIRNGLITQLTRIKPGDDIEEAHMRNRQLVAAWAFEMGAADNVIERKQKDGKTYFVINDYEKLSDIFKEQLKQIQKLISEANGEEGRRLIETYAVKVDQELHAEVLERFEKLGLAPYGGFINPKLSPVMDNGKIIDVIATYPESFTKQMLYYAKEYSFLPTYN